MIESSKEGLTLQEALANLQQKEDSSLRYYAAWWLGKFRIKQPAAIDALLEALEDESDRAPDGGYPLRRNAARALGKLEDTKAVPALIGCLASSDYYLREAAAQALESLGDRRAITPLIELLEGGVEAAGKVPGKPHLNQPYEAIIEALGTLEASEAIAAIKPFLEHPVPKIQYATARALYQLTEQPIYGQRLVQALQGSDLQLRRSALMDLGVIGYGEAAEAIANTLAENSMKLIALKGLLNKEVERSGGLSETAVKMMRLMDSLL